MATLRVAIVGDAVTDPLRASVVSPSDMMVLDLLYDGLTSWDARASTWVSRLAGDLEESADGLSWTFMLSASTFSDGAPITAADVVRSLSRWLGDSTTLPATRLEMVEAIEAVDELTVRFELTEPFALLPALLSSPVYGILPPDGDSGTVGSGPMHLSDANTLVPREDLELGISAVELVSAPDSERALALYEAGWVDLAHVSTAYQGAVTASASSTVEAHYALHRRSPGLEDVDVRRRVIDAISRSAATDAGFGAAAVPIDRLTPMVLACAAPCGGDAVAEQVAVGGLALAYVADAAGREDRLARSLVDQWAGADIGVSASALDLDAFVGLVGAGGHDLVRTGWVGLFPSADSQLSPYLSDSPDNVTGYADPAFDALLAAARRSGDPDDYERARRHLDDQAVVLPIARLNVRVLASDAVRGLRLRHDGSIDVFEISVEG